MIPAKIDKDVILADLAKMGWIDYKVEIACALPRGWISKLRKGVTQDPGYSKTARLINFWAYEVEHYEPSHSANTQTIDNTT